MRTATLICLFSTCLLSKTPTAPAVVGRYNNVAVCRGDHPRCSQSPFGLTNSRVTKPYGYHQFAGSTNIGEFLSISETLPDGPPLPHHQTVLAELISKRPDTNAVALWADATSIVPKGRVWGGFISARSEFKSDTHDSQLIGLEIDVLNAGKPGVYPNNSKVGLQIVGFGKTNTNAIEILNEKQGSGEFVNGFNVQPGAIVQDGAVFGIAPQNTKYGLNFIGSRFSDGAVVVSENQKIVFRAEGKRDASIYRDEFSDGHLVLTAGPAGMRVTNAENTTNLLLIRPDGKIDRASLLWQYYWPWFGGGIGLLFALAGLVIWLLYRLRQLERRLEIHDLTTSAGYSATSIGRNSGLVAQESGI